MIEINTNGPFNRKPYIQINLSSFATLLLIVFITLKLCGVIAWSWWWVLSPLWLPFILLFAAWGIIWFMGWLLFRNTRNNLKLPY